MKEGEGLEKKSHLKWLGILCCWNRSWCTWIRRRGDLTRGDTFIT